MIDRACDPEMHDGGMGLNEIILTLPHFSSVRQPNMATA